ncbi:unnamed protein product, partial [marine sediment metagenome]
KSELIGIGTDLFEVLTRSALGSATDVVAIIFRG